MSKPKTGRGNVQFAAATAAATGQSKATTNRALARADALGDTTLDKITGTSLEEEKHAAESGLDLKAYAEQAGKVRTTLSTKVKAWKVLSVTDIGHAQACEVWSQLAELHASPRWLWAALAEDGLGIAHPCHLALFKTAYPSTHVINPPLGLIKISKSNGAI